jgi:antitoxin ParD1/3/4
MPTDVHLTPEDEAFVRSCVASGRYSGAADVVSRGLRLLRQAEADVLQFDAMLDDVVHDVAVNGTVSADEVLGEMDEIIAQAERRRLAG